MHSATTSAKTRAAQARVSHLRAGSLDWWALAFGVQLRASEPEGMEAELWAAVPQVAAQRDVAPEPDPKRSRHPNPSPSQHPNRNRSPSRSRNPRPRPTADRLEKAKQEKLRRRRKKTRANARKKKAREKRALERQGQGREGQAGQGEGRSAREHVLMHSGLRTWRHQGHDGREHRQHGRHCGPFGRPSAAYAGRIKARIKPNIVLPTTSTATGG